MSIAYREQGPGLHLAIEESGHSLVNLDGVWVSDDDVAVQRIIDNYVPLTVRRMEERVRQAAEFGAVVATGLVHKTGAMNAYLSEAGFALSTQEVLAAVDAIGVVSRALRAGELAVALALLENIKASAPEYTDAVKWACGQLQSFVAVQ
jgi:hypothetical protein